jgi:hypothetical protein
MKKVIEELEDKYRGCFTSKEYLRGQIDLLITIVPEVFKTITNSQGLLLKILNKNISHVHIRDKITAYFLGGQENMDANLVKSKDLNRVRSLSPMVPT